MPFKPNRGVIMKKAIIFISTLLLCSSNLFSLGTKEISAYKTILSSADLIEISYGWWGNDEFNIDVVDKEISDIKEINIIIDFFSDKRTNITECGYDGTLNFKKNGISLLEEKILFTIECKRFVFVYKRMQMCVYITDNGIKYFKNLYNELLLQKKS